MVVILRYFNYNVYSNQYNNCLPEGRAFEMKSLTLRQADNII